MEKIKKKKTIIPDYSSKAYHAKIRDDRTKD